MRFPDAQHLLKKKFRKLVSMRVRVRGPSFYLNADPDPGMQGAKPMLIHADPVPEQTLSLKKLKSCMKNLSNVGNRSKT